ncbi:MULTISPECIES: response regulator [unclassified Ekhidna]|jgi:CheY-like chemotaxis protein|uniref:response regulator n=1 Tax=unclassified Ekhidna TaxID=2632188 RepID=UPI0032DFE8D3
MKKLNCILLIDDDNDCNFLHTRAIKKLDCTNSVEVAKNGFLALDYLKSVSRMPELIFLDINLPQMNAWEFLYEYRQLKNKHPNPVLIILTSSMNPDDKVKASEYDEVKDFHIKYLNKDSLSIILRKHFPENF